MRLAQELGPGHTVVTVLCDSGLRYQQRLFNPEFLESGHRIGDRVHNRYREMLERPGCGFEGRRPERSGPPGRHDEAGGRQRVERAGGDADDGGEQERLGGEVGARPVLPQHEHGEEHNE